MNRWSELATAGYNIQQLNTVRQIKWHILSLAWVDWVMAMLRAYLMIAPYKEPQRFVQDSLDAFLAMVISLKHEDLHEAV